PLHRVASRAHCYPQHTAVRCDHACGYFHHQHQRGAERERQPQRDRGLCGVRIWDRPQLDQCFWGREFYSCGKQHSSIIFNDRDPVAQHHLLLRDAVFSWLQRIASRQHCQLQDIVVCCDNACSYFHHHHHRGAERERQL